MRTLNTAGAALQTRRLAGEAIPVITLVHIAFDTPQRWALCGLQKLVWGGNDWTGRDIMLTNIQSEQGDLSTIQITLPGVTDAERALAFTDCEGDAVNIYRAWVDPADGSVADALLVWAGEIDIPGWQTGRESLIHFRAESRAAVCLRPSVTRYTNDEQRRLFTGDTSLDFDPATDAGPIVWPAASFFRV